jgi:hypothetical protein
MCPCPDAITGEILSEAVAGFTEICRTLLRNDGVTDADPALAALVERADFESRLESL